MMMVMTARLGLTEFNLLGRSSLLTSTKTSTMSDVYVPSLRIANSDISPTQSLKQGTKSRISTLIWIFPGKPAKRVLRPMSRLSSKSSATPIAPSP